MFLDRMRPLSGIVISLLFLVLICTVVQQCSWDISRLNYSTITVLSSSKLLVARVRLLCFLVVPFSLFFIDALSQALTLVVTRKIKVLVLINCASLFLTAVTISSQSTRLHVLSAGLFFVSMLLIQLIISCRAVKCFPFVGKLGLMVTVLAVVYCLIAGKDGFFSGFDELVLMGISAFWVISFSLLAILK